MLLAACVPIWMKLRKPEAVRVLREETVSIEFSEHDFFPPPSQTSSSSSSNEIGLVTGSTEKTFVVDDPAEVHRILSTIQLRNKLP